MKTPWHSDSVKTEKLTESVLQIWPSTEYAINLAELVEKWPSIRIFSPSISLSYFTESTESDLIFHFLTEFLVENSPSSPSSLGRGFSHRVRDRVNFPESLCQGVLYEPL